MLHLRSVLPRSGWSVGMAITIPVIAITVLPALVASGDATPAEESAAPLTITPAPFPDPDSNGMRTDEPDFPPVEDSHMFELNTHRAITNVAVRRADCTADSYLKDQLRLTNGIMTSTPTGQLAARIEAGAEHEDTDYYSRPLSHFFDPISHAGLNDWASGMNSLQWAYNGGGNQYDWQDARLAFYRALTQPTRNQRLTEMSSVFFDLGHVVHLVEDLAQPQHTRNDAHYVGAEFEEYCNTNYRTPTQINSLPSQGIPSFGSVTSPIGGIPGEFAAFWDTGQYTGQAGFTSFAGAPGLAEYSNAYFITDDTMFGNTRIAVLPRAGAGPLTVRLTSAIENWSTSANHRYPHPHIRNTNVASFFPPATTSVTLQREGVGLAGAVHYVDLQVRNGAGAVVHTTPNLFLINDDNEIGFDNVTHQSYAELLLPKAVSYAAGMINYFFRAKIGLQDPTTSWNADEDKNEIKITNDSSETFGPGGSWELYYDNASGTRTRVNDFDTSAYTSLAPGANFTAKFPEMLCDGGWEFTLVFKGKIGNENDAVTGRTFYTAPEIWEGVYDVPSGDPKCFGVTGDCIAIFERPTPAGYDIVGYLQFVGASDLFPVSGTCDNNELLFGNGGECGWLLSGTVSGATLTNGETCCWYCPLNPPPKGPWFCGTVNGLERTQ